MKVLISEDEVLIAEHLRSIIASFGHEVVAVVHNRADAIRSIDKHQPDIAFLDIKMEGASDGLFIARYIQEHYGFPFIFVTAFADIKSIQQALKCDPAGYVTKPFKPNAIFSSMEIAINKSAVEKPQDCIIVKDGYTNIRVKIAQIKWLKADNVYVEVCTTSKTHVTRCSLEKLQSEIPSTLFVRCHRSYIVNSLFVNEVKTNTLAIDGIEIPVSRKYLQAVREKLCK